MNILATTASSYSRSRRYLQYGPGHFLMYVLGRFKPVRSWMVWTSSLHKSKPIETGAAQTETIDVAVAAESLKNDGFAGGFRLQPQVIKDLLAFASMATCFGEGDLSFPFRYDDRHIVEQQTGRTFKLGRYNHALQASPVGVTPSASRNSGPVAMPGAAGRPMSSLGFAIHRPFVEVAFD